MRILNFTVENQSLSKKNDFFNVEGTVGYLYAKFDFLTDDWNGTVKKAIFKNKLVGAKGVLLNDDKCEVPPEVLTKNGLIEVSVAGTSGEDYKITTNSEMFLLNKTLSETDVDDFTPDMFQQIIGLIAGKADNMDISGNKLILKSGETVIATVDIPAASDEAIENSVNSYLQDNPIEIVTDKTLTEENVPADAKVTGDRITQLSGKVESLNNVDFHFCSAEEVSVDGTPNIENPMEKVIYFVPNNGETPNVFDEYIWHGSWEYFGSASVDMSDYVKFTDYASGDKAGVILVSQNRSLALGVELHPNNHVLRLTDLFDQEITGKNKITRCAIKPSNIDLASVQSAHQEMSDTYDPETALTPDGNVPYAYAGRQPVSYDAAKEYVDGEIQEILELLG